jgi:hypothetical protein
MRCTFGRVPRWASSQPSQSCAYAVSDPGCAAPTSDLNSGDNIWKEFVTAVVKYSLSSPELHIAYYEMWNEPDFSRNWTGTPAQLATMVKDAYSIVHTLDPKEKVVGPTPSTANQYGVHFLPDYYAAGAANSQDIVGIHAYLNNGSSFATNPSGITISISQLQKLLSTYGISSKPICFTEGSWSGSDSSSLSDSQRAAYLAQEYMLMWSTGAVSRYYWYAWDSDLGTLWTPSGGMTQAGITYNQLADWLIGSTPASNLCSEDSSATWTCSLTLSTGIQPKSSGTPTRRRPLWSTHPSSPAGRWLTARCTPSRTIRLRLDHCRCSSLKAKPNNSRKQEGAGAI